LYSAANTDDTSNTCEQYKHDCAMLHQEVIVSVGKSKMKMKTHNILIETGAGRLVS
jgi:hypothetical protein